jgi:hypothetical protein
MPVYEWEEINMAFVQLKDHKSRYLWIPDDYTLISTESHERNGEPITIERYQEQPTFLLHGAQVTTIYANDGQDLQSYHNYTQAPDQPLPGTQEAEKLAEDVWTDTDPDFARGLSLLVVENQQRSYVDANGEEHQFPVLWVKFAHENGSYNWVTVAGGNKIVEVERNSEWDYFGGRRATEEWDNDDWVQARNGERPQLAAPHARA